MVFEWDPRKSATNLRKHGVSFAEAGTIFGDELSITVPDPDHSDQEERFLTIGWSNLHRLLMVAHADRGENLRIISARELTKTERKAYEEAN
ncbi:MAG: BrnT family toxin [Chloroflexota bacterium]